MTQTPGDEPGRPEEQGQPEQPEQPTTPYPQQPYPPAYPPGPGYGYPAPYQYAPDHPRATTVMVLGILGIVVCQVLGPVAWWMGKKTVDEIDASGGRLGGRGAAQAGYVMGIVGTVLLIIAVVFLVIYFVVIMAVIGGGMATSYG
jgi:hypothetical protein